MLQLPYPALKPLLRCSLQKTVGADVGEALGGCVHLADWHVAGQSRFCEKVHGNCVVP